MEENTKKRRRKTNTPQNESKKSAKMNPQSLNNLEPVKPASLEFSAKIQVEEFDEPEPEALDVQENVEKPIKTEEITLEDSIEESQANSAEESGEAIDEPENTESIEDEASKQLNVKIQSVTSLSENYTSVVPTDLHYKISDDVLREGFNLVSQGTTSQVDKLIEIYIRNMLGRKQAYIPQSSLDEILQEKLIKWRMWHLTFPDIREAPIMYLCCVCNVGFWHFSEFREHIIDHKDLNYNIQTQNHDFRLIAHQGSNFERTKISNMSNCWKCGKDVAVHLRAVYKCDGCEKTHHNCTLLSLHEGTCEAYKEIYRQKGVDTFKSYTCPVCPYRHWEEKELERHMTSHTVRSDLPIVWMTKHCPKCSLAFQDYRVHECLNQQRTELLWCDYCSMKFQSKVMLAIHLSNSKVNAQCRVCNFYLKRGCIEAEHLLTHTETYVMLYKCSLCTYQLYFLDFKSLNDHRISKHFHSKKKMFFDKVIAPRSLLKNNTVLQQTPETNILIPSTIGTNFNHACLSSAIAQENPDRYRITSDKVIKTYTNKRKMKENEVTEVQIKNEPTEVEIESDVVNIKDEMIDIDESEVKTESGVRDVNNEEWEDSNETAHNHTDQPIQPMDLTDPPHPSRNNVLIEAQDVASLISATPFPELPTTARKSKAERQREYRQRLAASRTTEQAMAAKKADAERRRKSRIRKAASLTVLNGSLELNNASSNSRARSNAFQTPATESQIQPGSDQIEVHKSQSNRNWNKKWSSSILRFETTFLNNDFGYACSVCDRLWFKNDLKPITVTQLEVISKWFVKENQQMCGEEYKMVCNTCNRSLNKKSMPPLAKVNGFSYPDIPPGLPLLDPISERLISPCLPFIQVRHLRHDSSNEIIGQVINLPVEEQEIVKCLPRQLNEDDVININIKRNFTHKSDYFSEYTSKSTISAWLNVLQKSTIHRLYEINVDLSRLNCMPFLDNIQDYLSAIEDIPVENMPESEILASRQHTMMWNEEDCLNIAPGHRARDLFNSIYDHHAEELSFPMIYFGEPRRFNMGITLTPYMIATSETRRRDRRGATPQKLLYVAIKILRWRVANTVRNLTITENVTRMLEDKEILTEYVIQNLSFMKTVPNTDQAWVFCKRDLFAMIRQLGKPTAFLTISANEIHWMKLLTILLKLSKKYPGKTVKDLNTSERCNLVSDDPVTCCIYFHKLVDALMKMLKSKQCYNPFGKYFVKDYFLSFDLHQGSPQAHILLWLNDDPLETVSENMPRTIELVEKLCSVARDDVPNDSVYIKQIHKHAFTCNQRTCRLPYWPMSSTCVLLPIGQSDLRRHTLQQKAKELRTSLSERRFKCMDEFLNGMACISYLDIVRSTLRRPTLVFKRNFDELMTNMFNPYLAGEINSNIDIQFILDDYACAEYIKEYLNKSARGMSYLRREVTKMLENPDQDYTGQLKALSSKLLTAVEMTAQEAAWFLLQQPTHETSRQVVYIPTVWPTERQRYRKRRSQRERDSIDGETVVWAKNIIQRYEERPHSLEEVYLAEFAAWYANFNDFVDEEDDEHEYEVRTSKAPKEYRRRMLERVIRYKNYDIGDAINYKREMVLLYVPFRKEMTEIVDENKFLKLFDDNKDKIMERRSLYETNLNFENIMKELEAMNLEKDGSHLQDEEMKQFDDRTAVLQACNDQVQTARDPT